MILKLNSNIILESVVEAIISKAICDNTFKNPIFKSNELNGRSNWDTEQTIATYRYEDTNPVLPRGYMRDLLKTAREHSIKPKIIDERVTNACVYPDKLNGIVLRPYQQRAVEEALKYDQGVICAPTGSGKTLIGLEIIRRRQQKSLIIVHRNELAKQWRDVIEERMGIKAGFIGDGEWTVGDQITIAMVQTLATHVADSKTIFGAFGLVLVDEVHHSPASTFSDVIGLIAAKYRYGLSATLIRRDGLEQMIYRAVGPVIASISKQEVENIGATVPVTVHTVNTGFLPKEIDSWNDYLGALTDNEERNLLIFELAIHAKGSVLILCDRVQHAESLSEMFFRQKIDHVLVHGKLKENDRKKAFELINTAQITVGTTGLLGEGLDVKGWSVLIMASPISSEIKLMQAIGRIVRPERGKNNALVYDLRDECGFSGASFKNRYVIYQKHRIWVVFDKNKKAAQKRAA